MTLNQIKKSNFCSGSSRGFYVVEITLKVTMIFNFNYFFSYLATHKTAPTRKKVHMLHITLVAHFAHVVVTKKWQIWMCNTSSILIFSYRVSIQFFSKGPWLSLTLWNSSSLTFPEFTQKWISYMVHTFFLSLNSRIFKEILLMMYLYVYHKAACTFEASFSTPTYDTRLICLD